jgi:hypothetical protein
MDANSGEPWSEMDISDLANEFAHGRTMAETASFLCRDDDERRRWSLDWSLSRRRDSRLVESRPEAAAGCLRWIHCRRGRACRRPRSRRPSHRPTAARNDSRTPSPCYRSAGIPAPHVASRDLACRTCFDSG